MYACKSLPARNDLRWACKSAGGKILAAPLSSHSRYALTCSISRTMHTYTKIYAIEHAPYSESMMYAVYHPVS